MLDLIIKKIKENIAQYTQLFDLTTVSENCTAQSNILTIVGLDGEYILSGAVDSIASSGCFNTTQEFDNGVAVTDCFFGNDAVIVPCIVHTVNAGEALTREFAIEKMNDKKTPNAIIAYWSGTSNTQNNYTYTISEDANTKLKVDFGVMFRVKASDMVAIGGCDSLDMIFIKSVIETKEKNSSATLVKFESIKNRFYSGDYLVIDIGFSYLEDMQLNEAIKSRAKHFNATLNNVETKI